MPGSVPDIPGTKASHNLAQTFRYEVAKLLDRHQTSFPGAQPVSFGPKHLPELLKQDYYVCEKTDGIRCLMYMTRDREAEVTYLIDRKNEYYYVTDLHFPTEASEASFHTDTILDGELVNDTEPDGSVKTRYLVFDCLCLDGKNLMHRTLDKRLAYFQNNVFRPYRKLYEKYPEEAQYLPFTLEVKKFEFAYAIEMMFEAVLPKLRHGNDGLIFTCRETPYKPGTDEHILKWKPESENSVDFRIHLDFPMVDPYSDDEDQEPYPDYTTMPQINLTANDGERNPEKLYGTLSLKTEEWEHMKSLQQPLNDRIAECCFDDADKWRFLRFRDDKPEANHVSVVEKVLESIENPVTQQALTQHQVKIREEWKKRQAMRDGQTKKEREAQEKAMADAKARKEREAKAKTHGDVKDAKGSNADKDGAANENG